MAYLPPISKTIATNSFQPKSSFIMNAEYDDKAETMTLTFKNGSQYKYIDVGFSTWESFRQSPDHGSFYSKALKGRIKAVPVVRKIVGQQKSQPLKKLKIEKGLSHGKSLWKRGNRRTFRRAGLEGPGTVPSSLYSGD